MMEAAVARGLVRGDELNRGFHDTLLERCDNETWIVAVRDSSDRLDNMQRSHGFYGGIVRDSVAEHRELLGLLETSAEPERVERFCRPHMLRVVEAYLASTTDSPDPW